MDWEVLEGTKEFEGGLKRGPNAAYCNSKLANVYFGIKLAEKLKVSILFVSNFFFLLNLKSLERIKE